MKRNIIIFSVVILAACSPKLYTPSEADAARGSSKFPGLTVAELQEGRQLYETKCTKCHGAKKLTSQTEEQWRKIVPGMAEGAKKKGVVIITDAEQDKILKYVITMSSR